MLSLARELLSNAAQHARAQHIDVRLARDGAAVALTVRDDGDSFAPDRRATAVAAGHIGLATSAERVAAVGGSFEIASAPGPGTTITQRLPGNLPAA